MPNTVIFSVDLKYADEKSARLVHDIIKAHGLETRMVWGASKAPLTHALLNELDPEIATFYT